MARRDDAVAPRSVLVSRFSALGDVAIAIPELYEACRANPDTRFVMLTRSHPATLFVNPPENLTVEGVDLGRYKGPAGMWRLWREMMKRHNPEVFVDIHDVLRTKLLRTAARLHGCRTVRFRKGRRDKRALTRPNRKILLPLTPTPERYREAFRRAGLRPGSGFTSVFAGQEVPAGLFAAATRPKGPGERWMAIAPFARHEGKIYPVRLMETVVARYAAEPDTKIFIFGFGDAERKVIDGWARKYPAVVNMAALSLGLPAELALLAHCDVMLSKKENKKAKRKK